MNRLNSNQKSIMAEESEKKDPTPSVFGDLLTAQKEVKVPSTGGIMNTVSKFLPKSVVTQTSKSSLEDLPKQTAPKPVSVGKLLIRSGALLLILVSGASYVLNSANFKLIPAFENPAKQAAKAQMQLNEVQAEIHVQNHLSAALLLEEFSIQAGDYLYYSEASKSTYNSNNQREKFAKDAEELRPKVLDTLTRIRGNLQMPISAKEKLAASQVIAELKVDLGDKTQEIQDLESAQSLMQSEAFRQELIALNTEEVEDSDIQKILTDYEAIDQSLSSYLSQLRGTRIDWSKYLNEIEALVKRIDPLFNTEFSGTLAVNSLQFKTPGEILLSGSTLTQDSKNFTLVSNLMDILENSPSFKDVEEKTYSKNQTDEQEYIGNFRLKFSLESDSLNSTDNE